MTISDVSLSGEELSHRLIEAADQAEGAAALRRLELDFAEDADGDLALFITAIVDADERDEQARGQQLLRLVHALHDGARTLDLPVPWYVRVQDENAATEDPAP
jgi:HPt (histidine-containing phosphotransfer) domain-containing protein